MEVSDLGAQKWNEYTDLGGRIINNVLFGQLTDRTAFYQKQMEQHFSES